MISRPYSFPIFFLYKNTLLQFHRDSIKTIFYVVRKLAFKSSKWSLSTSLSPLGPIEIQMFNSKTTEEERKVSLPSGRSCKTSYWVSDSSKSLSEILLKILQMQYEFQSTSIICVILLK